MSQRYIPDVIDSAAKFKVLSHPVLSPVAVQALRLTMLFAILAGIVEWNYLALQDVVSGVEWISLITIEIGLGAVLLILIVVTAEYVDKLALAAFTGAIFYIFSMLLAAIFIDRDVARSLHAVLWLHPAFIAVSLTQPLKLAQSMCWLVVALLAGVILYCGMTLEDVLHTTAFINHVLILLSLCASASLLYALSRYCQEQGANRARIEVLNETADLLRAEVAAKEKARSELEQANRIISGFLDNMSHELRTPLNAVIGFSELIRDELFGAHSNQKYKEYAADILDSGQHLLGLVNNLLYYSKLSVGKITPDFVALDAEALLKDVADGQGVLAARVGVKVIVDAPGKPTLTADHNGVLRVLHGLLNNAIKFSRPDDEIILQAAEGADGACVITIKDEGAGIPQDELEQIFTPFRKGRHSEDKAIAGTGMGLAMAKMLVDLHDGLISIASREGEGTTVALVFPRHVNRIAKSV